MNSISPNSMKIQRAASGKRPKVGRVAFSQPTRMPDASKPPAMPSPIGMPLTLNREDADQRAKRDTESKRRHIGLGDTGFHRPEDGPPGRAGADLGPTTLSTSLRCSLRCPLSGSGTPSRRTSLTYSP